MNNSFKLSIAFFLLLFCISIKAQQVNNNIFVKKKLDHQNVVINTHNLQNDQSDSFFPCPVGVPSNPNPADGATNVSIIISNISWTNGAGTLFNEIYFGEVASLSLIYDGSAITSWADRKSVV